MLRSLVERLSRNRIIKRRLPAPFGVPLYVSPDVQLRYLIPGRDGFDLELMHVIREYICEESVVWDIGANVGVFALGAARVAQKGFVLAVEADAWLARLMTNSLQIKENRGLRVKVLPCAVADRDGTAELLISKRGRASNALQSARGRSQSGGFREIVTVPTLTLDTLLNSYAPPSFVKLDIEGAEAMALRGAERLLSEVRPVFYIEVGEAANDEVTSIFCKSHYELFDGSLPIRVQEPASSCFFNTVAKPKGWDAARYAADCPGQAAFPD